MQAFEFEVPAESALQFIPHVGEVPPLGTLRVQINFEPTGDDQLPPIRLTDDGVGGEETPFPSTLPVVTKGGWLLGHSSFVLCDLYSVQPFLCCGCAVLLLIECGWLSLSESVL